MLEFQSNRSANFVNDSSNEKIRDIETPPLHDCALCA